MALFSSQVAGAVTLLLAAQVSATTYLAPEQDITLPSSGSATDPLKWLGANSPYFAGPNVNGVSSDVPEGCVIDQVAYVVRHGSRYPDSGAYNQWVALYEKIGNATFTAEGPLAFLKDWQPVLSNPTAQMSQESSTGYKEAYDLGYQLRTRYPQLYAYGTPFISWANLYPRVVQTAQNFVRGFLGSTAASLGTVITVNSTGSPNAFFDSLSPSDLCPAFVDGNGGTEATTWASIYLPPVTARLNALLTGNLNFTTSDVSLFPYLCGFESQITGTLSPWCGTFTDDELLNYEYAQDLRYYYGMGPGTGLPSTMMLPFLNSLVGLLEQGPGLNGTFANGTEYTLPSILTAFLNDGQITELGAATGIWDDQTALSGTEIPTDWKYIASHFVSMRGTVAFERMTCSSSSAVEKRARPGKSFTSSGSPLTNSTLTFSKLSTATAPLVTYTPSSNTTIPTRTRGPYSNSTIPGTFLPTSTPTSDSTATYVRILLNDAVYPLPACNSGPGSSCLLSTYISLINEKFEAAGSFYDNCNVTNAAIPTEGVKGASFFRDAGESWLAEVVP